MKKQTKHIKLFEEHNEYDNYSISSSALVLLLNIAGYDTENIKDGIVFDLKNIESFINKLEQYNLNVDEYIKYVKDNYDELIVFEEYIYNLVFNKILTIYENFMGLGYDDLLDNIMLLVEVKSYGIQLIYSNFDNTDDLEILKTWISNSDGILKNEMDVIHLFNYVFFIDGLYDPDPYDFINNIKNDSESKYKIVTSMYQMKILDKDSYDRIMNAKKHIDIIDL